MDSILSNGILNQNASGKVYITDVLMTPDDVMTNIFIDNPRYAGRGDYAIIFKPDPSANIKPSSYLEYVHEGKLNIGEVIYAGKNTYSSLSNLECEQRLNMTRNQTNSRGGCE